MPFFLVLIRFCPSLWPKARERHVWSIVTFRNYSDGYNDNEVLGHFCQLHSDVKSCNFFFLSSSGIYVYPLKFTEAFIVIVTDELRAGILLGRMAAGERI